MKKNILVSILLLMCCLGLEDAVEIVKGGGLDG